MTPRRQSREGTLSRDNEFTNKAVIGVGHLPIKATCPKRLVRFEESYWGDDGVIVVRPREPEKACVVYAYVHMSYMHQLHFLPLQSVKPRMSWH